MKIRQLALVASQLAPVERQISEVFGIEVAYRDPGVGRYGLENAVWPVGDTFLEVVAPTQDGTTAGRYLDRRGGDGGYMVILQTEDIAAARERIESLQLRVVEKIDRNGAWGTHIHPKDIPGAILSIDAMDPPEEWQWAGPDWRDHVKTDVSRRLLSATIQTDDPAHVATKWAQVLHRPIEDDGASWLLELDEGTSIRFVTTGDERGEGMCGIDIEVVDPAEIALRAQKLGLRVNEDEVEVCGVLFRLVMAE